uniref:Uncharacterized protein n=1 Tax=Megaselia scalaris TaxID=36166 RepID=T1GHR7_MEGSC
MDSRIAKIFGFRHPEASAKELFSISSELKNMGFTDSDVLTFSSIGLKLDLNFQGSGFFEHYKMLFTYRI